MLGSSGDSAAGTICGLGISLGSLILLIQVVLAVHYI